ncbi:SPOR domain-containing protein [Entomobacter blattae]|uniref:Sporulation related domain protein n=1 Tax=Entomobacter blattae TaxID=2762277 RepID=A0A7H1NUB4_9PROT|nr:SPOR domain-containing protein [Entomobacter blattae]QNT79374.1 Sporulation related domain protein [Entomobacter blattae]
MAPSNSPYQDPNLRPPSKEEGEREPPPYSGNGEGRPLHLPPESSGFSRERMGISYDDEENEVEYDRRPRGGFLSDLLPEGISASKVIYGLLGVMGVVVVAFGVSSIFVRHKGGVPIFAPPAMPVKVKPANPGGMQPSGMIAIGDTSSDKVILAPPPETPHPEQLSSQYNKLTGADQKKTGSDSPTEDIPPSEGKEIGASDKKEPEENTGHPGQSSEKGAEESSNISEKTDSKEKESFLTKDTPKEASHKSDTLNKQSSLEESSQSKEKIQSKEETQGKEKTSSSEAEKKQAASAEEKAEKPVHKGKYAVQLGALNSAETAQKTWEQLKSKAPDLMEGRIPVIQKISSNGKTFYRLRTKGFLTSAQAAEFCRQISTKGAFCTVANF